MASTEVGDIAFSTAHNQQAFKLLELPPELLALLESDNPPILSLTPDSSATGNGHALLSTPDKSLVYHVRQKNTSNPLHLLSPAMTILREEADTTEEETSEDMGREVLGICSIAMIDDTLELYPVETGKAKQEKVLKVNKWHEKFAKGRTK